ncbi:MULTISPECIES: polysaccharide pyruvyl transferase family protein [unclassified Microbacterium]|uniref:polysaccharide pyruvyl transferase family protein n=1 Tax=unclassified Microbacterium TaxID=2609290 RepID=UPI00300FF708
MIRTYYWQPPIKRILPRARGGFRYGNAGDSFNIDLIRWAYGDGLIENVATGGKRALFVGSIGHRAQPGDVLSGVGVKSPNLDRIDGGEITVVGLRGPLTLDALRRAGLSTDRIRFLGDPGLLIDRIYPELMSLSVIKNRVVFIPHYRERHLYRSTKQLTIVDIDAPAFEVARSIAQAEFVYSSSLHGLIWAHALGRPAHPVAPNAAGEASFKYRDYCESIGLAFNPAESLDEALRKPHSVSPADVSSVKAGIVLPSSKDLRAAGVLT